MNEVGEFENLETDQPELHIKVRAASPLAAIKLALEFRDELQEDEYLKHSYIGGTAISMAGEDQDYWLIIFIHDDKCPCVIK